MSRMKISWDWESVPVAFIHIVFTNDWIHRSLIWEWGVGHCLLSSFFVDSHAPSMLQILTVTENTV